MIRDDKQRKSFLQGVRHPDETLMNEWTTRIRSGERGPEIDGIARRIIQDFGLRHFLNVPQSPIAIGWLADALHKIQEYEDPLDTLGLLPRPAKRPADPQRGWDLACWIAVAETRGYSRSEAVALAADVFFTDISNVRRLAKQRPEWMMNPEDDAWEDYFMLRERRLPPFTASKAGEK